MCYVDGGGKGFEMRWLMSDFEFPLFCIEVINLHRLWLTDSGDFIQIEEISNYSLENPRQTNQDRVGISCCRIITNYVMTIREALSLDFSSISPVYSWRQEEYEVLGV